MCVSVIHEDKVELQDIYRQIFQYVLHIHSSWYLSVLSSVRSTPCFNSTALNHHYKQDPFILSRFMLTILGETTEIQMIL